MEGDALETDRWNLGMLDHPRLGLQPNVMSPGYRSQGVSIRQHIKVIRADAAAVQVEPPATPSSYPATCRKFRPDQNTAYSGNGRTPMPRHCCSCFQAAVDHRRSCQGLFSKKPPSADDGAVASDRDLARGLKEKLNTVASFRSPRVLLARRDAGLMNPSRLR